MADTEDTRGPGIRLAEFAIWGKAGLSPERIDEALAIGRALDCMIADLERRLDALEGRPKPDRVQYARQDFDDDWIGNQAEIDWRIGLLFAGAVIVGALIVGAFWA